MLDYGYFGDAIDSNTIEELVNENKFTAENIATLLARTVDNY